MKQVNEDRILSDEDVGDYYTRVQLPKVAGQKAMLECRSVRYDPELQPPAEARILPWYIALFS